eukprot:5217184-Amphidinium_carterae.1
MPWSWCCQSRMAMQVSPADLNRVHYDDYGDSLASGCHVERDSHLCLSLLGICHGCCGDDGLHGCHELSENFAVANEVMYQDGACQDDCGDGAARGGGCHGEGYRDGDERCHAQHESSDVGDPRCDLQLRPSCLRYICGGAQRMSHVAHLVGLLGSSRPHPPDLEESSAARNECVGQHPSKCARKTTLEGNMCML